MKSEEEVAYNERLKEQRWLERIEKRPINLMWTGGELEEHRKKWQKEDEEVKLKQ